MEVKKLEVKPGLSIFVHLSSLIFTPTVGQPVALALIDQRSDAIRSHDVPVGETVK